MIEWTSEPLDGDIVPQVIYWRPISYFCLKLRQGVDQLDRFSAASFKSDGGLRFDLRHYAGHPPLTTTAYTIFRFGSNTPQERDALRVIAVLPAPRFAVAWQAGQDFVYGQLQRNRKDRLREPEARIIALKIAASRTSGYVTTSQLIEEVGQLYPFSPEDLEPSPTRANEARWPQIIRNLISHQDTPQGPFALGYAERTKEGLRITDHGRNYLNSLGFLT